MLNKLRSHDRSILFGTQDLNEATQVADLMMLICEGQIVYLGKVSHFLRANRIGHQLIIRRQNNFQYDAFERLCSLHVTKKDVQLLQESGKDQFALIIQQRQTLAVHKLIQSMRMHGPLLGFTLISSSLHTVENAVQNMLAEHRSLECVSNQSGILSNLLPSNLGLFHVSEAIIANNSKPQLSTIGTPLLEERSTNKPMPAESGVSASLAFEQIKGYFLVMLHSAISQFRNYYLLGVMVLFLLIAFLPVAWVLVNQVDQPLAVKDVDLHWKRVGSQPFSLVISPANTFQDHLLNTWSWSNNSWPRRQLAMDSLLGDDDDRFTALMFGERLVRAFRPHAELEVPIISPGERMQKENMLLCAKQMMLVFHFGPLETENKRVKVQNRYHFEFDEGKKFGLEMSVRPGGRSFHPNWIKKWIQIDNLVASQTRWPRNEIKPWEFISDLMALNGSFSLQPPSPVQLTIIYNARIPHAVLYAQDSLFNSMLMMPQGRRILENRSIVMQTRPLMLSVPGMHFLYFNMPYRLLRSAFVSLLFCWTSFVCNSSLLFLIKNQVHLDWVRAKPLK